MSQSKGETGDNSGKSQDLPAEISGGTLILTKHNVPRSNVIKVSSLYGNEKRMISIK